MGSHPIARRQHGVSPASAFRILLGATESDGRASHSKREWACEKSRWAQITNDSDSGGKDAPDDV